MPACSQMVLDRWLLIFIWELLMNDCKRGGGGAATAVVEAVLVLILLAMSCFAVFLGWRHYKTRSDKLDNII